MAELLYHRACARPPKGILSFGPRVQQRAQDAFLKTATNQKNWRLLWFELQRSVMAELEFRCTVVEQRKELREDEMEVVRWVNAKGNP